LATKRWPRSAGIGLTLTIAFAVGAGVAAETRTLAIVAEQHTDAMMPRGSAMAAQQLRRVKLIERQRDQSESEAVSCARTQQPPVPTCSSLQPLTRVASSAVTFTRITVSPGQMGGVPCIRGLRIPVATVVDMVADGMGTPEIVKAFPDLEPDDVTEALRYAAEAVRERELPLATAG
jgi:uncharacterized protein (DUF433 family)